MAALFQQCLAEPLEQPRLAARFKIGWQPRYQTTILFLSLVVGYTKRLAVSKSDFYIGSSFGSNNSSGTEAVYITIGTNVLLDWSLTLNTKSCCCSSKGVKQSQLQAYISTVGSNCQAQFKSSSVPVQLGTETCLIITVKPTPPTPDKYIASTQEAEIWYAS